MRILTNADIYAASRPGELIDCLAEAFGAAFASPDRMHCDLPGDGDAKLLVMPSWQGREAIGVKVATVMPENGALGLPTIDGVYVLLDGQTGSASAILEARALTALRTAAVSALAARLLSRPDAKTLLLVGTGALAPHLARAHAAVRGLTRILVWGRSAAKAQAVVDALSDVDCEVAVVASLPEAAASADIISCATLSSAPLIMVDWVRPGTHLDLVGSFAPDMREADEALFRAGRLVIDTPTALKESGDLLVPHRLGWIAEPVPELADVVRGHVRVRSSPSDITIFKAVGTGLSDIAAARYFVAKAEEPQDLFRSSIGDAA